ncbi:inosine/xanthosine triphosphatase [Rufibacter psychrotolerans]|uniref:inosine/xanthosine triphosphatase n=1 Tax=Rufibacter psychrotolerans TaxID=2812556 RepID=UPI001967993B|nr:inosine/xanthosine triphosphatase [Rufibacter sp. SYSU D00308]
MMEKKVVVASTNPVKVQAALAGLKRMFPESTFRAEPVSVASGVADQPYSDEETLTGALNRVQNARAAHPDADFWVGLEGGVQATDGELATFAWIVVQAGEKVGKARSGTFFLPQAVAQLVAQGVELGPANDQIFRQVNSKQKGGAIGILSQGVLDRKELYEQAVLLALVPFKSPAVY